jgi:hypothetical protein
VSLGVFSYLTYQVSSRLSTLHLADPDGIFIRIIVNKSLPFRLLVPYVNDRCQEYGRIVANGLKNGASPELGQKGVDVEYSSPNTIENFKPTNLGSTLIGALYIANLDETWAGMLFESTGSETGRTELDYLALVGLNLGRKTRYGSKARKSRAK